MDHSDKMWARGKVGITFLRTIQILLFPHWSGRQLSSHFPTNCSSTFQNWWHCMVHVIINGFAGHDEVRAEERRQDGNQLPGEVHLIAQIFLWKSSMILLTTSDPTSWQWKPNCWKRWLQVTFFSCPDYRWLSISAMRWRRLAPASTWWRWKKVHRLCSYPLLSAPAFEHPRIPFIYLYSGACLWCVHSLQAQP